MESPVIRFCCSRWGYQPNRGRFAVDLNAARKLILIDGTALTDIEKEGGETS
jgi:hypothetical protein